MKVRKCKNCGIEKPLEAFRVSKYRRSKCKVCEKKDLDKFHKRDRKKAIEAQKERLEELVMFEKEKVKRCSICLEIKSWSEFTKQKGGKFGRRADCRDCIRIRIQHPIIKAKNQMAQKKWRKANKERITKDRSDRRELVMAKALDMFNFKCKACGHTVARHLQWHHINGKNGGSLEQELEKMIKIGKPDPNLELLCSNCHIDADIRDGTHNRGSLLNLIGKKIYEGTNVRTSTKDLTY